MAGSQITTELPTIPEWFSQRNVFVTGGTGYMGKALVYKLLVSCRDLGNVFLLIRERRGVDPASRLQLMLQQEPFITLRKRAPESLKKIVVVTGDTKDLGLCLSEADNERLMREVSVVFHMAANVKFDMPLKEAITVNTQGTLNVLAFAKQLPHLAAFIHTSTSYCQCLEAVLEERYYPTEVEPESMIATVNKMTPELLDAMTGKILENQPNTYAFSKALSEDLVYRCGLPSGVARPSIVTASWKEPLPGWVDNMNGATGMMVGAGKGVIRTFLCDYSTELCAVPCDVAVNSVIALAWKVGIERPEKPIFINVSNTDNPITWSYAVETGRKIAVEKPFSGVLWYPGGSPTSSTIYHWIRVILFQLLPAYLIDMVIFLAGQKPFLVRVQHKIITGFKLLQYYTMKKWVFPTVRAKELQSQMCPSDREEFFMDTIGISWPDYIMEYMMGTRKYCLKDDPSTIPRAKKVMDCLYYADYVLKAIILIFIGWCVYSWMIPYGKITTTIIDTNHI